MVGGNVDKAWEAIDGVVVTLVIRAIVERAVVQVFPRVGRQSRGLKEVGRRRGRRSRSGRRTRHTV